MLYLVIFLHVSLIGVFLALFFGLLEVLALPADGGRILLQLVSFLTVFFIFLVSAFFFSW